MKDSGAGYKRHRFPLKHWLQEARIENGPVFRRIDQWGNVDRRALTLQSINLILKSRCAKAGLNPEKFSLACAPVI